MEEVEPAPAAAGVEAAHVLDAVAAAGGVGDGVHWSLAAPGDLNVNVVHLGPGARIDAHRNDEVDVALLVADGSGVLVVEADETPLGTHWLALVPRGTMRTILAGEAGLTYVTVHRRRGSLTLGQRRPDRTAFPAT